MAMGELQLLTKSGNIEHKLTWNQENGEKLLLAKKLFEQYRKKGLLPIGEAHGGGWKHIFTFDPDLKRIIFMPLMAGG
ncbi:MAG: hypothetical protein JSV20_05085 [Candidatus Bathyarchaeota archaeon]|nr:MAG: hypothetical protein JSV20_05085 [Candidatus Bathyarchaeota archaeon]